MMLPPNPNISQVVSCRQLYDRILLENISLILGRYGKQNDYPWIDTKFDINSGRNFSATDPIRGHLAVYGWIQGRALESIAGHIKWLRTRDHITETDHLIDRSKYILSRLVRQIEKVRCLNNGHLYFMMTPDGKPFRIDTQGRQNAITLTAASPYNYTDLFVAKGLYAAGVSLEDNELCDVARQYCINVYTAIRDGSFASDQQQLDPGNPSQHQIGRHSFAPSMLGIGMMALLLTYDPQQKWLTAGLDLVDTILDRHVNLDGKWAFLQQWDVVEFIDDNAHPYESQGLVFSDPGHALEFVGLTLKLLDTANSICQQEQQWARIDRIVKIMPHILKHNFRNGYQSQIGGICKIFDLLGRKAVNSNMPWWSLPETMRAAIYCWQSDKDDLGRSNCMDIISKCHNSFISHYLRPQCGYMAVQTLAMDGSVSTAIPAVPDADPCYHTGLSLIDFLIVLERNESG